MNARIQAEPLASLEHVVQGSLHLTQHGDVADRILEAGDAFRLDRNGTAVLCALERSTLTLTAPRPSFFASRILHYRAGSSDPRVLYDARRPGAGFLAGALAWLRHRWVALFAPRSMPTTASL